MPLQYLFPDPRKADRRGLVSFSEWMDTRLLTEAYMRGIFPWFEDDDGYFYWFSLNPRMVLRPGEFRYSKSLRRTVKSGLYEVRVDTCFPQVMQMCAMAEREGQDGTWISPTFQEEYCKLHDMGLAHSFETFRDGRLVGGLYGVSIGNVFSGESMFHIERDASKVAFVRMVEFCRMHGFSIIDAQQPTRHLASLGARPMQRDEFLDIMDSNPVQGTLKFRWNNSTAILLLGSNEGDRLPMLINAIDLIAKKIGRLSRQSTLYESAPWGMEATTPFLNLAVAVETRLSPQELLQGIKEIERQLGRTEDGGTDWRNPQRTYASRPIDIDIMLYDNKVIDSDNLQIPHPRMQERRFALTPLCEICPDVEHPVLKCSLRQILDQCEDTSKVEYFLKK